MRAQKITKKYIRIQLNQQKMDTIFMNSEIVKVLPQISSISKNRFKKN